MMTTLLLIDCTTGKQIHRDRTPEEEVEYAAKIAGHEKRRQELPPIVFPQEKADLRKAKLSQARDKGKSLPDRFESLLEAMD